MLIRHLPYVTALTDDVLMLRDGEIMATFAVAGIGAATAESVLVGDVADAVQAVVAQATPDLGFYLHRVSFVADARLQPPLDADPFSHQVDRRWQAALAAMELRERRSFLTVVLRPQKILGLSTRLFGAGATAQRDLLSRRVERLNEAVSYLMETLAVAGPERLTVGDGRWLGLLRTLVTGRFEPTSLPPTFEPVANLVAGSSVRFEGDRFLVPGASTEDMRFGAVFSLKAYPASTAPGALRPLRPRFRQRRHPQLHADRAVRGAGADPAHGAADGRGRRRRGLAPGPADRRGRRSRLGPDRLRSAPRLDRDLRARRGGARRGGRAGARLRPARRLRAGARGHRRAVDLVRPASRQPRLPRPGGDDLVAQLRALHRAPRRPRRPRR